MQLLRKKFAPTVQPADEASVRLDAILDTAVDAIITTDCHGIIESFNRAAEDMFGYRAHEVIGRNVSILVPEPHASRHDQYIRDFVANGNARVIGRKRAINAQRRDGSRFPIELALSCAEVGGRRIFTGIISDISRRRLAETELLRYREDLEKAVAERTAALEKTQEALRSANARLRQLVRIDELTGIGNRRAFDERLAIEWRRRQRDGGPLSVLICDVDRFKEYNDHYGHPAGDDCLRQIATAFNDCFQRAMEFVARYGGEEFAAILSNTDLQAASGRAEVFRAKIRELAIEHAPLGANRFVTISVGVATMVPSLDTDSLELVESADTALYCAKENGRDRVEVAPSIELVD